jgi:protoheme IX farnesyltransferase
VQLLLVTLLPVIFDTLGVLYLTAAVILGLGLLYMAIKLYQVGTKAVARSTYKYSTAYLAFLFLAMIFDRVLLG